MKAVRCCEKHVNVVDVPPPSGDGILVNVRSAGICGSDLHMLDLGFPITSTLGHEVAGVLKDGREVAVEPVAPCGHCDMCVQGDYYACRKGPAVLYGVGMDGGMAEQMLVPARCIVPLPNNVRAADACLVEPLAVAVHGINMLDLTPSSRVAVIGAGAVGLAATAVLSAHLKNVHVAARHDAQKEAVLQLGGGLDPQEEYDAVIECAGNSSAMAQAARLCKPGGTIILLATYWEEVKMPATDISLKSLTVKGSFLYGNQGLVRDVEVAAQLMAARPQLKDILITHRMPLDAAVEAFATARDRKAGAIKVVLEP